MIKTRFGVKEVEKWIQDVDSDGDGHLSFEEFKTCVYKDFKVK